ncbi:MAG: hypothetical protein J3Q66DRAFT_343099 [Benniella sp.]|nr:MAG: hypothetical protein J3Q66DRAFT_343099 [Benniella sp.]
MSTPRNSKRSRLATAAAATLTRPETPQLLVPSKQKDPMAFFSEEVALHIFEALSPSDLGKCACVSRLWHRLVNDQVLWRRLFFNYQFIHPRGLSTTGGGGGSGGVQDNHQLLYRSSSHRLQKRKNILHKSESSQQQQQQQQQLAERQRCWKALYRLNYNWIMGQARVTTIATRRSTCQDHPLSRAVVEVPRIQDKDRPPPPPIVQFKGPVLLIAHPNGTLQFWRIKNSFSTTDTKPAGCTTQPSLWHTCQYPHPKDTMAQKQQQQQNVQESARISCLAMDTSDASATGSQRVVIGYESGHFSVVEYSLQDKEGKPAGENGDPLEGAFQLREIGHTVDLSAWSDVGKIVSVAFRYPILTTCSEDDAISIYKLETDTTATNPQHWCRLLHRLYGSPMESPIGISLEKIKPVSSQPPETTTTITHGEDTWRVLVSFGVELFSGSWTMRLQEIEFDEHKILHSTEMGASDHGEGYVPSLSGLAAFICGKTNGYAEIGSISAVSISWPLVVTAHRDNTMNVFQMTRSNVDQDTATATTTTTTTTEHPTTHSLSNKPNARKGQLQFRHVSTLYGHCGAVSSVSIESKSGRLVSASMDRSIKIWTIPASPHERPLEKPRLHRCSVSLSDINKSWTESGQVTKEEGLGLIWVGSDEEKIVSMNCDGTVKVWQFS